MLRTELPAFLKSPDFKHGLSEDDCRRVEDVASSGITPKMLLDPTHIEVVALLSRLCLLGGQHPQVTDHSSIMTNVVEQAAISLRHAEVPAALHSVERVAKRIEQAMGLPEALSWRAGIETDDIHTLCCIHLFRAALLSQAYKTLVLWATKSRLVFGNEEGVGGPEAIESVKSALKTAKGEWITFADDYVQALLRELGLLAEHETDFVFPLERLQMFSLIGVHHSGACLSLGDNRLFHIQPVADINPRLRPPGEWRENDDLVDSPSPPRPRDWPSESDLVGNEIFRGAFESVAPIGDCRVLATWRGSPRTVAAAREQIPRVMGSAITTAVMAQNFNESMLELLVSPLYTSRLDEFRTAAIDPFERWFCLNIESSPPDFPIAKWLTVVLKESLHAADRSLAFVGNASRLLLGADNLLHHSPEHSFVCSVAAIETCVGSRGESISASLASSSARLVCPDTELRSTAVKVFKALYDLRSRVVHGEPVTVTRREAVFMRFIASCVIYNWTGFAKAQMMMDGDVTRNALRTFLGLTDLYNNAPIPGSTRCEYLMELLKDPERRLSRWIQLTA